MNITGLRDCSRGSSFGNESRIAATTISREKMLGGCAGHQRVLLLVECEVELEDVDAGLAEEAERAAVGVVVDQLLHASRAAGRGPRRSARACSCA